MAQLVTETYAGALYEVGVDAGMLESIYEEFKAVVEIFESELDFFELFKTPKIANEEKKQIVQDVFGDKVQTELVNFLKVLIDKRRTYYVIGIFEAFEVKFKKHFKMETALVTTVQALSDEQESTLKVQLSEMTGLTISIKNIIDESVIGGMLIQIGDRVIDNTLKRRLGDLKESLNGLVV
ncbi:MULTISPECIES: F0F1 ATP synthase subunit delta [unclassified Fusibacter]|uniref:F0F1 ATP synthase subunit delta n=1 Tax=unclassified Fusibacter TaxID=2624464 RepID=UPI0010125265|nr:MULTISPECIES: F0F1 ATP synthase subunit delta [unclassified Fusibacter]MCK8059861.1 F0F1 ATP synthase subunit delta [Fusibacter sp. A2]NPE21663.1 F0F1 ATP synthase subunit delta [Fusibacter sp. A1]RXV62067.1 F0F1 ATP synthase subunit delta [Fusibacter sp. A1]